VTDTRDAHDIDCARSGWAARFEAAVEIAEIGMRVGDPKRGLAQLQWALARHKAARVAGWPSREAAEWERICEEGRP